MPLTILSTVEEVVEALLVRAQLTATQYDVSALTAVTKPVRSLYLSQIGSTRVALEMLAACYFFTFRGGAQIEFVVRGGAAVATIPWDDLGADGAADRFAPELLSDIEVPAQIALTYDSVENDYQPDTQYSDRIITSQVSTEAVTVPLGFTASEAKQIADALLLDKICGMTTARIALGAEYSYLQPADVIIVTDEDGSLWRMRIQRLTDTGPHLSLDLVLDDATIFTQAGTATTGDQTQTVVNAVPDTTLLALDVPLLRDADDGAHHLVAVNGGGSAYWRGCGVYKSVDNVTYTLVEAVGTECVFGETTDALDTWAGWNIFDEVSSVTVEVSGELSSATEAAVLARRATNAALVGNEVIQFRTATLVSPGVYTLTGLLRGRRGTQWAMTGHAIADRFVLLSEAGMRRLALQTSELGVQRYAKGVSSGQSVAAATAVTFTPAGVALKPFAPVAASADRATADTVLAWHRRTRLSTRITGPLAWSCPLGESTEAYAVDVYSDNTFTTLKRTLTASDSQVTYTEANQITDFGSGQTVLYVEIFQLSSIVGRGYALRATV